MQATASVVEVATAIRASVGNDTDSDDAIGGSCPVDLGGADL